MDPSPAASRAAFVPRPGLIVLRALGKFFGLAGARVGFVLAEPIWLQGLRDHLGPWTLAGPSRWVAARALADRRWQEAAPARPEHRSARLAALLERYDLAPAGGCGLFQWTPPPRAAALHEGLEEASSPACSHNRRACAEGARRGGPLGAPRTGARGHRP